MSSITIKYIDPTLLSSSVDDLLRVYLERSYEIESTDLGESLSFNANEDYFDSDGTSIPMMPYISSISMDVDSTTELTGAAIVPSYRVPIRVTANPEYITKNAYWRAFVQGGNIQEQTWPGFYSSNTYTDHQIECSLPYGAIDAAYLSQYSDTGYETISITPSYNYYLPEYESHAGGLSEALIPNIYNYQAASDVYGTDDEINEEMLRYITLDDTMSDLMEFGPDASGENVSALLQSTIHQPLPPQESLHLGIDTDGESGDEYMVDRNYNLRMYLTGAFPTAIISGSLLSAVELRHQNIMFDGTNVSKYLKEESDIVANTRDLFPMYNSISIPASLFKHSSGDFSSATVFRDFIKDREYSPYFINVLRLALEAGAFQSLSFITDSKYSESDEDTETNSTVESIDPASVNSIDLIEFLFSARDLTYGIDNTLGYFVGPISYNIKSASEAVVPYTYQNSIKSAKILQDILPELYGLAFPSGVNSLEEFYDYANNSKYYEVMAFRVEKTDEFGTKICDYWTYNEPNVENIIITDTQIKYGKAYTYNVFAYKLVVGLKYRLSNLTVSEKMGDTSTESTSVTDGDTTTEPETTETDETAVTCSCMRWTFAEDESSAAPLAKSDTFDLGEDDDGFFTGEDSVAWQADMYLYYEPSVKILEIPIFSKTLKVEDNPCSKLDIIPYQKIDSSQKIGFKVRYKAFAKEYSPDTLTPTEATYILDYYNARDKLSQEKITEPSRSRADTIEVYRMEEMPIEMSDFSNHLLKSYDLKFNSPGTTTFVVCEDMVETNKKYYYTFRAISSHGLPGPMTEIYESELRSDGGYNYSVFRVLHKSDLQVDRFTNPSKVFKKLINIRPNMRHLIINDENLDYNENSYTQVSNLTLGESELEDTLWGKTFKVRLTSKKTGKKIDLNITYNLENG